MLMGDHFRKIYRCQPAQYERLVAREDQHGNLFAALNEIIPLHGLNVVEFGAGTGRVTRLLSVLVERIFAFDIEPAMLERAMSLMLATGMTNWSLALGDNTGMPVSSNCADLVIEGWSFAHVMEWQPQDWQRYASAMLAEMRRIVKPGGTAILVETLGTGRRQPQAPTAELARLYEFWQTERGFKQRWIRTDYQFATAAEADELTRFFFGAEFADKYMTPPSLILPECTGIWWRRY